MLVLLKRTTPSNIAAVADSRNLLQKRACQAPFIGHNATYERETAIGAAELSVRTKDFGSPSLFLSSLSLSLAASRRCRSLPSFLPSLFLPSPDRVVLVVGPSSHFGSDVIPHLVLPSADPAAAALYVWLVVLHATAAGTNFVLRSRGFLLTGIG